MLAELLGRDAARDAGSPASGSAGETGIDFPGESPGIVLPVDTLVGLDDRQRADRPGHRGDADPDGGGVRRARERRRLDRSRTSSTTSAAGRRRSIEHRRVVSTAVARGAAPGMLQGVVSAAGTGGEAAVPGYLVAGKTGTAAKPDPPGGYSDTNYVASFVGIVPASAPRLVILVSIDEPHGPDLRRRRRGAGLPRHRPVRAPVPRRARRTIPRRSRPRTGRLSAGPLSWLAQPAPHGDHTKSRRRPPVSDRQKSPHLRHFGDDYGAGRPPDGAVRLARRGPGAADRRARAGGGRRARRGRDSRPRLRRPRARRRGALLLRPGRAGRRARLRCRRRSRTARSRSSSSGRSTCRVPQLVVADARAAMAVAADEFFGRPTEELTVAGVTGTTGKTTTAFLLYAVLAAAGRRPGLLGTIETRVNGERRPATRTTAEAIDLQRAVPRDARRRRPQLRDGGDLARLGAAAARPRPLRRPRLHEPRARTTSTSTATWRTTSTRSGGCSSATTRRPPRSTSAMLHGRRLADELRGGDGTPLLTFGLADDAESAPTRLDQSRPAYARAADRLVTPARTLQRRERARGAARLLGIADDAIRRGVASVAGVPGRFETVDEGQPFTVDRRLRAQARRARERAPHRARADDRAADLRLRLRRRPRPRQAPADGPDRRRARRRRDRHLRQPAQRGSAGDHRRDRRRDGRARPRSSSTARAAIGRAIEQAGPGDVVVIAGKGHERGQEIAGVVTPFDDTRGGRRSAARAEDHRMIPLSLDEVARARARRASRRAPWATEVTGLQTDSRRVEEGDLFVAVGRRRRLRQARVRPRGRGDARPRRRLRRARRARRSRARPERRPLRRDHRLDGEDLDEGHPRRDLRAAAPHGRRGAELQRRDRRAADDRPRRAGHRALHPRAGDARLRPDRRALRVRPARRRRDHERRPGAPREGRRPRRRRPREERADRRAPAGRHRRRPGRLPGRARRPRGRPRRRGRHARVVRAAGARAPRSAQSRSTSPRGTWPRTR